MGANYILKKGVPEWFRVFYTVFCKTSKSSVDNGF